LRGASAAEGAALPVVRDDIKAAFESIGTMGVALSHCTGPAAEKRSFTLGETRLNLAWVFMERRVSGRAQIEPVDTLVEQLVTAIVEDRNLNAGEDVALRVNNFGGTTIMELNIAAWSALKALADRNILVQRAFVGTFLSAWNGGMFHLVNAPE
jgi:triose/dihydroxyacetone kinase / FAD-AMP lyase (cyclizing)